MTNGVGETFAQNKVTGWVENFVSLVSSKSHEAIRIDSIFSAYSGPVYTIPFS